MNSRLTLSYAFSRDGDDFGWLRADVYTPDFSARNGMWVQWQDLGDFAAELSRYPLTQEAPVTVDWGYGTDRGYESVTKIVIAPRGPTGGLIVSVSLANNNDPTDRCAVRFDTDYPSAARFADALGAMMRREAPSATLAGDRRHDL
jgi:hypothetical protein